MVAATIPPIEGLPAAVVAIVHRLRAGGLAVSTSEALDAIAALSTVGLSSRTDLRTALKATLVKDTSHEVLFARSFDAVFPMMLRDHSQDASGAASAAAGDEQLMDDLVRAMREGDLDQIDSLLDEAVDRYAGTDKQASSVGHHTQRALRRMNVPALYRRYLDQGDARTPAERGIDAAEASAMVESMRLRMETLVAGRLRDTTIDARQSLEDPEDRPLLLAGPDELAAMRQAMRPLARRLATRLGNRRRRGTSGLDMRRTIRASMGTGGVPVTPVLRRKRPTKPDLIVLCDVSGSTAEFAPFTLTLLHAVHQEFRRVRSFVFVDGIVEITDILAGSPGVLEPTLLLGRRGLIAQDGRSDYQRVLATFLQTWGDAVTAKTTVIVAGDTRSHRRASAARELAELQHRARRLYWLNPEPRHDWDTLDSCASEYGLHCTDSFEVSTIRQLISAVTQIV
ncbi:MAG: VWA domain-containing protein [Actinomycetales bacterium]|nr:VWA domain-containing protein [Actinomycetales bacterium]